MFVCLIGESGCGKSTTEKILREKYGYQKVVTCTTRPPRDGEVNGVNYHFLTDEEYDRRVENNLFIENASYRGWKYGTPKGSYDDGFFVIAVTPAGYRAIKRAKIDCVGVYIKVDRRSRLICLLNRGDDIEEAYRRSLSDVGQFDSVDNEVDYVISNPGYYLTPCEVADMIASFVESHKP